MRLSPLSTPRASEELAGQLRAQIRSGELPVGSRLPSQRDLAADLSIGRQAVQEALALLELEGYLEIRRGAQGGSFVCEPVEEASFWLARMRESREDIRDIFDFRIGVECQTSMLAAERRSDADLVALREAIRELPGPGLQARERRWRFREADSRFHVALAVAAGSSRLQSAVRQSRAELFLPTDRLPYEDAIAVTRAQHFDIYLAVADRDAAAAARAMTAHIEETREHMRRFIEGEL